MRFPTRKITAIFLLSLVLAPLSYIFIFQAQRQSIYHRMQEKMENESLQVLVLEKDDIRWFRPGKEIILDGRLFDVKDITPLTFAMVQVTGLFDEEETKLADRFRQAQEEENPNSAEQLISIFQLLQCLPGEEPAEDPACTYTLSRHYTFDDSGLPSPFCRIITPPPQS